MNNIFLNKLILPFSLVLLAFATWYFASNIIIIWMPFIIAYIVANLLNAPVTFINKMTRIPRAMVSLLSVVSFILLGGFILIKLGSALIDRLIYISKLTPNIANDMMSVVRTVEMKITNANMPIPISIDITGIFDKTVAAFISGLGKYIGSFAGGTLELIKSLPNVIIFSMVIIISSFLIVKDYDLIHERVSDFFSKHVKFKTELDFFTKKVFLVIWGYLKAQMILMSITFTLSFIGLTIFGIKNSLFIALGIAFVDALPIFGPATVYIPWILTNLILGNPQMAAMLFGLYISCTFTRQLLEPKIVGQHIGIFPLVTLISMYTGLKLIGIFGIILGPLSIITVKTYYDLRTTANSAKS